ncbi:hypothetical protein [Methylophaga sp.]|uniref:hypothetical protein n=1 Tax=Methylophaga sp. TaxID=2024840 RepID=UPI003F6A3A13
MIFMIFTEEGLREAETEILSQKATLWLNPSLHEESDLTVFNAAGIDIHVLPEQVDTINEKTVMSVLTHVEKVSPKTEIFVEYL